MTTEYGNRLIAEYMGGVFHKDMPSLLETPIISPVSGNYITCIDKLKYHSSWDWLMPVVIKISLSNLKYRGHDGTCRIHFYSDGITVSRICNITIEGGGINTVWTSVIEFIKSLKTKS